MNRIENKRNVFVNYIGILVSILAGVISFYAQSKDPQTGLLLFLALIGSIFVYFLVSWPIEYFRKKWRVIESNSEDIEDIKKDLNIIKDKLNFKSDVAKLDTRISVIEKILKMKNKKGQIDPRWIVIIIILIIFFLYLRSKGII